MRPAALVLAAAGLLLGLAAESVAFGWRDWTRWAPDLAVGWILFASAAAATHVSRDSFVGPLLALAGTAWFLPNFGAVGGEAGSLAGWALTLHRGLLIHALLSFPTGRLRGPLEILAVTAAYVTVTLPALRNDLLIQAGLGVAAVVVAVWRSASSVGPTRRAKAWSITPAAWLALSLAGLAGARLVDAGPAVANPAFYGYHLSVAAVGVALLIGLQREPWRRSDVTDLVIELGTERSASVRDALAAALGDPRLEVGYRLGTDEAIADPAGRPIRLPAPGSGRSVTAIPVDDNLSVVLVHDPAALDDPQVTRSLAEAARLIASNARLQTDVSRQMAEVEASRRRLLDAEVDERGRIQARLRDAVERPLERAADTLEAAVAWSIAAAHTVPAERAEDAQAQLRATLSDLNDLTRGLYPAALEGGLPAAIRDLASGLPLPIETEVSIEVAKLTPHVSAAAYFVCAEALANVVKHAHASHASVVIRERGAALVVEVTDDGIGGADEMGSGLRGLRDRVDALGGRLDIASAPGAGTRLAAEVPLGGEA
ncbi:sensor histidine kinase [soil metagenome]